MPRMIDLVRASALPNTLVQSMAKGAIALPPREVIEILVYLATHNADVKETAAKTLAGWNETQLRTIIADPKVSREVAKYFDKPRAVAPTPSVVGVVDKTPSAGPELEITEEELSVDTPIAERLEEILSEKAEPHAEERCPAIAEEVMAETGHATPEEEVVAVFMKEHEQELAAEADKPFEPIGGNIEEEAVAEEQEEEQPKTMAVAAGAGAQGHTAPASGAAAKKSGDKKGQMAPAQERGSVLQKISQLDIKGRIQLALKGSKEERSILIRDAAKLVSLAVLESPKITDGEVEKIASQKNVLQAVLRQIPMKRRYAKNYIVVRNLVFNPRTPLDLALGLMKNLLITDLKNLSGNKEVSDTIRKLGLKMYKQKLNPGRG
ncbi:MAG TPA: hypothetical protein VGG46_00955 [Terriglobales bacterium]